MEAPDSDNGGPRRFTSGLLFDLRRRGIDSAILLCAPRLHWPFCAAREAVLHLPLRSPTHQRTSDALWLMIIMLTIGVPPCGLMCYRMRRGLCFHFKAYSDAWRNKTSCKLLSSHAQSASSRMRTCLPTETEEAPYPLCSIHAQSAFLYAHEIDARSHCH